MKTFWSVAVLVLAVSMPAHGQMGAVSGLSINPMPPSVPILPHYPPADFQMLALSGSVTDFFPSTYLPFNEAVHEGIVVGATERERITLAEVARRNRTAHKGAAEALFVQDDRGNAILIKKNYRDK